MIKKVQKHSLFSWLSWWRCCARWNVNSLHRFTFNILRKEDHEILIIVLASCTVASEYVRKNAIVFIWLFSRLVNHTWLFFLGLYFGVSFVVYRAYTTKNLLTNLMQTTLTEAELNCFLSTAIYNPVSVVALDA